MTDQKKQRRTVALPRLHASIEEFCAAHDVGVDQPVGKLLEAVQAAWFAEAKK